MNVNAMDIGNFDPALLMHVIAAKAVAFLEALQPQFATISNKCCKIRAPCARVTTGPGKRSGRNPSAVGGGPGRHRRIPGQTAARVRAS